MSPLTDAARNPRAWELISLPPDPIPARPLFAFSYSEELAPDGLPELLVTQPGPTWETLPISRDLADVISVYRWWYQEHPEERVVFFSDLTLGLAGGQPGQMPWEDRQCAWEAALYEAYTHYEAHRITGLQISLGGRGYPVATIPAEEYTFYDPQGKLTIHRSEEIPVIRNLVFAQWARWLNDAM